MRVTDPTRFAINLKWQVAKVGGNRVPGIRLEERAYYNKLDGYEFPWMLVSDEEEIENIGQRLFFLTLILQLLVDRSQLLDR